MPFVFRAFLRILLLAALCLIAGCAKPTVTVDAFSGKAEKVSADARYIILPGATDVDPGDLTFTEYKIHLEGMLRNLGYAVTDDKTKAGAVAFLSWSSRETVQYSASPGVGVGIGVGSGGYYDRDRDWGGGRFFGLGVGFPLGGGESYARWRHNVTLDAKSLDPAGVPDKSLWKVRLGADSNEDNLRVLMPAMLDAAKAYIGKDTPGPVTVEMKE